MTKYTQAAILAVCTLFSFKGYTQQKKRAINGIYLQWGYNAEWYTRSNIHFKMANGDDFILHKARAHNNPGFQTILDKPLKFSLPQYNYRLGFYLNKARSRAFEINFDHAKYIVTNGQTVHVTGKIDGITVNGDSVLNPSTFLHFEHTDGANFLHFNYVQLQTLCFTKNKKRALLTSVWKAGAGINIPRSDFTWRGDRLNNKFHVAGYNISGEGGLRLYPAKRFFLELTGKTGYVRYVDALAETSKSNGNRASHGFGYLEFIGTLGFDIHW
ncbi:MAG: hypothetical protein U0U70_11280 [Chitinophagaceae bacterium]